MSEDGDTTAADGIASPKPTDCSASDGSPGAASTTVSTADESADVDVEVDDSHARHLRPKRRSVPAATFGCPVCGVTLRQQELQQHWQLEVDRLQGIARNVARRHRSDSTPAGNSNRRNPRRESLERVRANRDQRRLGTGVHCPVCHVALRGCPERLAEHVNNCLARCCWCHLSVERLTTEGRRRRQPVDSKPGSPRVEEAKRTDLDLPKGSMSQVVNSLRERLRQLQEENQAVTKCLICMDPYENPVVSVVCWHVHCQECWLKTLGAKKLCPQCNSITSASDLRRIYL
ncbi:hypothetical protein HPB49_017873 [Dermacentor silvarum]|uniref:Uncharacterized protein n=1 Tax=Dermacentor silvarum TaxID=543639 RepID=A0ACB8DK95_DERSI|nr:hypothetical protein HPB49_017873 [Dermacentor silvarum]